MRILASLIMMTLPFAAIAETTLLDDDGPWIAVPVGMTFDAQMSPADEIKAMADLDGNPDITTAKELEMIALLTQLLGAEPITQ